MRKRKRLVKISCDHYEMAIRLGAEPIREEWVEITEAEAMELGLKS